MTVGSEALLLTPSVAGSAPPATVAVLVTGEPASAAALGTTTIVSGFGWLPPAGITTGVAQLITWPLAVQLQFGPPEPSGTNARPGGNVSVTVMGPEVAAAPMFCTPRM